MATTKKAITEAEQAAEIKEATAAPTAEPEAPAVTLDELEGMDMNMFDVEETESAPRPVWRITDDGCADWACRKIADMKTAPVFSLESSRNTSRQSHTRQPRQNTATAFSPALW